MQQNCDKQKRDCHIIKKISPIKISTQNYLKAANIEPFLQQSLNIIKRNKLEIAWVPSNKRRIPKCFFLCSPLWISTRDKFPISSFIEGLL